MVLLSYVIYRAYLPMALSNCWAFISSFDTGALGLTLRLFLGLIVELLQEIFGICWLMLSGLERSRSPFNSNFVGAFNRGILVKWCGPASYLENENWMKKFTYQRKHGLKCGNTIWLDSARHGCRIVERPKWHYNTRLVLMSYCYFGRSN